MQRITPCSNILPSIQWQVMGRVAPPCWALSSARALQDATRLKQSSYLYGGWARLVRIQGKFIQCTLPIFTTRYLPESVAIKGASLRLYHAVRRIICTQPPATFDQLPSFLHCSSSFCLP